MVPKKRGLVPWELHLYLGEAFCIDSFAIWINLFASQDCNRLNPKCITVDYATEITPASLRPNVKCVFPFFYTRVCIKIICLWTPWNSLGMFILFTYLSDWCFTPYARYFAYTMAAGIMVERNRALPGWNQTFPLTAGETSRMVECYSIWFETTSRAFL